MSEFKPHKYVSALPAQLEANSVYFVRSGAGFDLYVTNSSGTIVSYSANYQPINSKLTDLANKTWTSGKVVYAHTADNTFTGLFVGAASSTDLLDRAAGDERYFAKAGDTMTGKLTLPASTTVGASLNIPTGVAPTSPNTGDLWFVDATGLILRRNGTNRTIWDQGNLTTVSQAEAEAGSATTDRVWTAERVRQAANAAIAADTTKLTAATGQIVQTIRRTSAYTAVNGDRVLTSTAGGAWTLTLPASGYVEVVDLTGTWATNNLTINPGTKTIRGNTGNLVCDVAGAHLIFMFDATANYWVVSRIQGVS